MLWSIFALLSAVFDASFFALLKRSMKRLQPYALVAVTYLLGSLVLFSIALARGIPPLGQALFPAVAGSAVLTAGALLLILKALEDTDLSLAMPMLAFTSLFLIMTSFLFLGELPSLLGSVGIALIVLGSLILNRFSFRRKKGLALMLGVALIYSVLANVDKIVVLNSDVFFGSSLTLFLIGLFFLILGRKSLTLPTLKAGVLLGGVLAAMMIAVNLAYSLQIVPYVIAIKRTAILFSVIYGGVLFKEGKFGLRLAGAAVMLAGVLVILLS
ncbi:MAG: DMT family transporter [Nanoarchaeota archaeon]